MIQSYEKLYAQQVCVAALAGQKIAFLMTAGTLNL